LHRDRSSRAIATWSPDLIVPSDDLAVRTLHDIRGLYFVGAAAANSFGPLMRFAFGAGFAARRLTVHFS
jgi:hypothetical protein